MGHAKPGRRTSPDPNLARCRRKKASGHSVPRLDFGLPASASCRRSPSKRCGRWRCRQSWSLSAIHTVCYLKTTGRRSHSHRNGAMQFLRRIGYESGRRRLDSTGQTKCAVTSAKAGGFERNGSPAWINRSTSALAALAGRVAGKPNDAFGDHGHEHG
jgi:hypothetical protein